MTEKKNAEITQPQRHLWPLSPSRLLDYLAQVLYGGKKKKCQQSNSRGTDFLSILGFSENT